jgi:hypothetical protein
LARKHWLFLLPLALPLTTACGKSNGGASADIEGIAVRGSAYQGMTFAAVNVDQTVGTSRVYHYSFADGAVHEVLPGESGNPAVFYADGRVFLFNRTEGQENFRSFDPRQSAKPPTDATALTGVALGDPWDVAALAPGKTLLLASPLGGELQTLDYTTGTVGSVAADGLATSALRPHALMRVGEKIYVLHDGVATSGATDGSQRIYTLTVAADGTPAFQDKDGLKLSGSNPTAFLDQDGQGGATIVGLCGEDWTGCVAGADRLQAGTAVTAYGASGLAGVTYVNQVVDGPADAVAYAHVKAADGTYQVARLDLDAQTVTKVHAFDGPRLYGIAYDKTSRVLFVAGVDGLRGTLTLYQDDKPLGSFALDGVMYSSTFVPK